MSLTLSQIYRYLSSIFFLCFFYAFSIQANAQVVRVAALKYGTVSWELDVIKHHGLAEKQGIELEILSLASSHAINVTMQGGRVDLIVGDWIWVSRQRDEGRDFTSFPYSLSDGRLMVDSDSGINSLIDMQGKNIGIAGTELNKNWLILRAYSLKKLGLDIADITEPSFAAPPLLNQLMLRNDFSAALNFWHYAVDLDMAGMKPLLSIDQMLEELSIPSSLPLLVWVFREGWAVDDPDVLNRFLNASYAAKNILAESFEEWKRIMPLTNAKDEKALLALQESYKQGIPNYIDPIDMRDADKLFKILSELGGSNLVGKSTALNKGTFYIPHALGTMSR